MAFITIFFAALAIIVTAICLLGVVASITIGFTLRGRSDAGRWQARGKYAVIIGTPLFLAWSCYLQFQPNADFYLQRFSDVALQAAPSSAKVVAKSPSLFGLHSGESCAYSRIQLSREDYATLLKSIATDSRFTSAFSRTVTIKDGKTVIHETDLIPDTEMRQAVSHGAGYLPQKSSFIRQNTENREYGLIFLADEKHIEVHSCL